MTYPRLYAQFRSDTPVELMRGLQITDSAMEEIGENMGEGWAMWVERAMMNPEGAHNVCHGRGRPLPSLAFTREEKAAMTQDDYPWAVNAPPPPSKSILPALNSSVPLVANKADLPVL